MIQYFWILPGFFVWSEMSEIVLMILPAYTWQPNNYLQAPRLSRKGASRLITADNWGLKTIPPCNLEHQQTHNSTIKTPKKQQRLLKHKQTHRQTNSTNNGLILNPSCSKPHILKGRLKHLATIWHTLVWNPYLRDRAKSQPRIAGEGLFPRA